VVHVVREGDNLLAIAYQYDVSVQSLIEINAIENPRALQVGQGLIIPSDDASLLAMQPTATPTPMPLRVVNLAFHHTPVGSAWCLGEVENDRDESLDLVEIQISLYNVNGELIGQVEAFTAADVVPGHAKAPFAILLPPSSATRFASYEVTVLSARPITHWGRRHRALTVEQVEGEISEGTLIVQGVVHNQGEANAKDVRVTLTAYGGDGAVVAVRQEDVGWLAAGGRLDFSLMLVPAAPAARVEAVAWGMEEVP
jgi:LysM repeat protein